MKQLCHSFLLALFLMTSLYAADEAVPSEKEQAAMMQEMMALAGPGPEHELFKGLVGSYTLEGNIWMAPGATPMTISGTTESELILGGRFLKTTSVSGEGQMRTESFGLLGFDRRFGHYTSVGFDTWGTYYVTAAGKINDEKTKITMYGEDIDPVSNMTQKYDFVYEIINDSSYVVSVIFYNPELTQGAESFKMVELTYTKK